MNILLTGILINTFLFGYMALTNEKMGISHKMPLFLLNPILNTILTFAYPLSFLIILLSPGGLLRNIIISIALQFLINHIIWGGVVGIIGGLDSRKYLNELKSKYKMKI